MTRKKWRLRLVPTFSVVSATSKADAYRRVAAYREDVRLGMSRLTTVVVLLDEGSGWATYERVDLTTAQA